MGTLIMIIVWFLFAYGTMRIAQNKGYDKTLWFVLGFLFGIIALIIIAFIPSKKNQ